jgi:deoxycytidylate deaminase
MRFLSGTEEGTALEHLAAAAEAAGKATCERARCGTVIVRENEIIGHGYNSPPNNDEHQRRCGCSKESYHKKVTDKTCCVHAEQRAILDALRKNPEKLPGSRLYFIRVDEGGKPKRSGKPYCTICSKMALDVGIDEFVLWHEAGVCVYDTKEYNALSFSFDG